MRIFFLPRFSAKTKRNLRRIYVVVVVDVDIDVDIVVEGDLQDVVIVVVIRSITSL